MGMSKKVVFKEYLQNQTSLLPPSLDELIPANHPVRIVNRVIDRLDIKALLKKYRGGGASSYNPRLMLKILVYAYLDNVYSSRKMEAAVKENIHYMWLAGMKKPDHNTINRFRSDKLKGAVKEVFSQVVLMMVDMGQLDLKQIYVDGTKLEANANRYTFVWGKSVKRNKERIVAGLQELWDYTQKVAAEELRDCGPVTFDHVDPKKVEETIASINRALKDKPLSKAIKQKLNTAKRSWKKNLEKYQNDEKILGERNSYSKTDHDATFMRMKEDHLNNGQLKPGYNTQISTQDQIVTNYTIHQNAGDPTTLPEHVKSFEQQYDRVPDEIIADAAYGSEENYELLASKEIQAYVKYNSFDREQREGESSKSPFHRDKLYYNAEQDCFICPMGQKMDKIKQRTVETTSGYTRVVSYYQATNCIGCPLRGVCHKSAENRIVEVSHRLEELKNQARERLLSEKGIKHRRQRPVDVEPVFAMIKHNKGFRRFNLRGLEKVNIEFGLLVLAHNLAKWAKNAQNTPLLDIFTAQIRVTKINLRVLLDNLRAKHSNLIQLYL